MALDVYLLYVAAATLAAIVPGPTVTVIAANGLTHGMRAGLLNVAGGLAALALMMAILAVGLASVVAALGWWFDWLRVAGALYLIWLGWKLLRASGAVALTAAPRPRGGFLLQGFLVVASNPKTLFFFGAFIPQFIDPAGDYVAQVVLLGGTAMIVASLSDGAYAVLSGRAGRVLSRRRVQLVSRLGGLSLVGGGLWLAFARAR
ncbi:MAG: LysE family translocator [Alphaproteobacteria bacterium]|nr:LysE family translocator [Alphaproteobacteria bacterium]